MFVDKKLTNENYLGKKKNCLVKKIVFGIFGSGVSLKF